MSDPGLTNRLRQRSRRAGLAVGLSMGLTIAVCIGSFAWIYAKADPYLSDFVGADSTSTTNERRTPTAEAADNAARSGGEVPTETPEEKDQAPTPEPTREPTPTPTPDEFQATHISNPNLSVNFRPQPTTDGDPIAILAPATQLQYLGEQTSEPDGEWLRFRTEDGLEGWLREGTFQQL